MDYFRIALRLTFLTWIRHDRQVENGAGYRNYDQSP